MMTDFEEQLEEKRKAFEADQAERAAAVAERRRSAENVTAQGVALLQQHVLPILLAAQRGLQQNKMDLLIQEEFDVTHFSEPVPKVSATCGSPARSSDGYRIESRPLIIEVKEGRFFIGLGKEGNRRFTEKLIAQVSPEEAEGVIQEQLLKLTDEAFGKLKDFHGPWS
jgi:hypothetical protein